MQPKLEDVVTSSKRVRRVVKRGSPSLPPSPPAVDDHDAAVPSFVSPAGDAEPVARRSSGGGASRSVKRARPLEPLHDVSDDADADSGEGGAGSGVDSDGEAVEGTSGGASPRGKRKSKESASGGRWTVAEDAALRAGVNEVGTVAAAATCLSCTWNVVF